MLKRALIYWVIITSGKQIYLRAVVWGYYQPVETVLDLFYLIIVFDRHQHLTIMFYKPDIKLDNIFFEFVTNYY